MSSTLTRPFPPVLVRADEAEHLDSIGHVLLADSSATAGALSSHRVALGRGADGAVPHRHDNSSELFYILDGTFDLLVEDNVVTARTGDLLVVPPGAAHAFAAHRGSTAEALIIATPGIERFDYFRSTPTSSTAPRGSAPARPLDHVRNEKARHQAAWLAAVGRSTQIRRHRAG
jgi:quercetin dioxygenase-like cupin family protein